MKHIVLIFALSFFFTFNASSQDEAINVEAVNNYKYIIVPLKYDLFNEEDKYQINSLTQFLFNKYGYTALLETDTFPDDLMNNRCLALTADVVKAKGGILNTKVQINLLDCKRKLIAASRVGKTKEKEYKVAYNLALRDAFETFQFNKYTYKPNAIVGQLSSNNNSTKATDETSQAQEEIERLKQEVAELKQEKLVEKNVIVGEIKGVSKEEKEVKKNVIVGEIKSPSKTENKENTEVIKGDTKMLYAQPIENGFQVVDQTPKVVMILLETPKENTFIVKDQNAIVYKEDGFWYLSKNDGKSTSIETLNIKF